MFPNPQDVLPIPNTTDPVSSWCVALQQASGADEAAILDWATPWVAGRLAIVGTASQRDVTGMAQRIARYVDQYVTQGVASSTAPGQPPRALSAEGAQQVMARLFGFRDWIALEQLRHAMPTEPGARFEQAADAIVHGNEEQLAALLQAHPWLAQARSTRAHGATLLHYVAANGVENYRQQTPANIVDIAARLLAAGSDVHATCDVNGGDATTLGLTITSAHPRAAGVQQPLAQRLLNHGATIDAGAVRSCLANGCPEMAEFMANLILARGGTLRIDEAAGIGRADLVAALLPHVPPDSPLLGECLQQCAWYDRVDVIDTLVASGVSVDTPAPNGGDTALHVASYLGNAPLVARLLAHGASVHVVDSTWHTTPIVWAQHAWTVERRGPDAAYERVVALLRAAGANEPGDATPSAS